MSASLHAPSISTTCTSDKKASVISNNKPNCNTPKGVSKTPSKHSKGEDIQTPKPSSEAKMVLTDNKDESKDKMSKPDVTPDTMSGTNIEVAENQTKSAVTTDTKPLVDEATNIEKDVVLENIEANASNKIETQGKGLNDPEKKEEEQASHEGTPAKKIITSEEEAKAKLAEKRREAKEKMEREAELQRQRQVS